jgi:acylphosphatase
MKARRYVISGLVQGVSFRAWTREEARKLNLAGWVMNLPDGRVACLAQGEEEALHRFERFLGEGPPSARVEHVQAQDLEADPGMSVFEIRFYRPKG